MSFPTRSQIFNSDLDTIIPTLSTVSLDTFYQVVFSFGKFGTWYKGPSISPGSLGLDFKKKMSLMCSEAELPGTSYATSTAIGHHQGIVETFPNLRQFPPLNLTFYVDAEHIIIDVLESWMDYINPVKNGLTKANAYSRFAYPDNYKEVLHIVKYERSSFSEKPGFKPGMYTYEFVNIWPTNLTSMKVNYGQSDVLKCSVQLAYDRYFTNKTAATASTTTAVTPGPSATASDIINRTPAAFNTDKLPSVVTNEYYNNFGDNTQNSTNFGDFTSGKNTGVFGQAVG